MNRGLPACALRLIGAQPGVLAPALVEEVDVPVGESRPNQSGKRIHDAPEIILHAGSFAAERPGQHADGGRLPRLYFGIDPAPLPHACRASGAPHPRIVATSTIVQWSAIQARSMN